MSSLQIHTLAGWYNSVFCFELKSSRVHLPYYIYCIENIFTVFLTISFYNCRTTESHRTDQGSALDQMVTQHETQVHSPHLHGQSEDSFHELTFHIYDLIISNNFFLVFFQVYEEKWMTLLYVMNFPFSCKHGLILRVLCFYLEVILYFYKLGLSSFYVAVHIFFSSKPLVMFLIAFMSFVCHFLHTVTKKQQSW